MWQKCPICNGTGNSSQHYAETVTSTCKVCEGKGIISELTGLPPKGVETFASPKYRNSDGTPVTGDWDNIDRSFSKAKQEYLNPISKGTPGYNIVESYYNK